MEQSKSLSNSPQDKDDTTKGDLKPFRSYEHEITTPTRSLYSNQPLVTKRIISVEIKEID